MARHVAQAGAGALEQEGGALAVLADHLGLLVDVQQRHGCRQIESGLHHLEEGRVGQDVVGALQAGGLALEIEGKPYALVAGARLRPADYGAAAFAKGLARLFGVKAKGDAPYITADEINMLVNMGVDIIASTPEQRATLDETPIDDESQLLVAFFDSTRQAGEVLRGERWFSELGCASCHVPAHVTASDAALPELSEQEIVEVLRRPAMRRYGVTEGDIEAVLAAGVHGILLCHARTPGVRRAPGPSRPIAPSRPTPSTTSARWSSARSR